MFPTVSEAEWEEFHDAYPGAFDGVDTWIAHISCTLVRTPEQQILVDTGLGPSTTAFVQFLESGGELPQRLAEEGVAPSDIDVVFLTYLHSDHVGWNTEPESDDLFFPNARYIAPEADWEFCQWRVDLEDG